MYSNLEAISGLKFNNFAGYSRTNPGDKTHTVTQILKVTSGSTPDSAAYIDNVYKSVITAGTHLAPSSKVLRRQRLLKTHRDINIAFVNELAKIFSRLDIDTHSVLEAAGTKWNFLPLNQDCRRALYRSRPIICPKANQVGYNPEIILSGRRLNDSMGQFVVSEFIKLMIQKDLPVKALEF